MMRDRNYPDYIITFGGVVLGENFENFVKCCICRIHIYVALLANC